MLRYVPDFIYSKSRTGELSGTIDAYVLFIDVVEFTTISNELRKEGKRGAEALNQFLSTALTYPIEQVELNGGFVSHFAGDAFCAVFPGTNAAKLRSAVDAIRKQHVPPVMFKTDMGDYPIKLRITVSCGTLNWNIYPSERQHEYVFSGKPLLEIKSLGKQKQDLALSEAVRMAFIEAQAFDEEAIPADEQNKPEQTANFISKRLQSANPANEIRDGAYCFVNLSYLPKDGIESALALIHEKLDDYGGYLNKLDDSDKGLVALILFGLPKGMGNTLERACRFSLELVKELPKLSMGLSCGNAYAGYVGSETTREYTALGSAVNLASRLMQKANWGEILTDSYLEQEMHYKYQFESADTLTLKGFAAPVHCHRLIDRLPAPPQSFMAELVGREAELELIRQAVDEAGSRIMYISGEPGLGKSRLILEALKPYPKRYFLFCDPSGHKLLEPIKQFLRQHFAFDSLLSREVNQRSFREQWSKLAGEDKELQRIESIVGDLLGYEWERSIWSMLPPNERPEQQKKAFATLLARIVETDKIIIHLDDPQWLDDTDTEYFRQLGIAKIDNIVIIAACRYLDDGSTVDLEIPNCEARHLELTRLSEEAAVRLIRHLLKVETLPPETQDWIVKKADGNPLFIEQVVAYLKENDCFDGDYKLKGNLDYLSSFGIADIIGSRIDSLTEAVRNTLQHACVLGLEFNTRVLSEMLSRKLDDDLGEGKQARVWADIDELRYIFTHVLIKDTAYNRMLNDKLKTLHLLAAETMEKMYHDDEKALNEHSEEIARHFENAGLEEKAAEYFRKSGIHYLNRHQFVRSENMLRHSLRLLRILLGEHHISTLYTLIALGDLYKETNEYQKAKQAFNDACDICHTTDNKLIDRVKTMNRLATVLLDLGELEEAESLQERALELLEESKEEFDIEIATIMNDLAYTYEERGYFQKALPLYRKAFELREITLGRLNIDTNVSKNNLGTIHLTIGNYDEAKQILKQVLDDSLEAFGENHPATSRACNNLGTLYYHLSNYEAALRLFYRSYNISEVIYGQKHTYTTTNLNNLAVLYTQLGDYEKAESLLLRSIPLRTELFGKNHPILCDDMNNLGTVYEHQAKYEQAMIYFQNAYEISNQTYGVLHQRTILSLQNIAGIKMRMNQLTDAETLLLNALKAATSLYGEEHVTIAKIQNRIGTLYDKMQQIDKGIKYLKESLKTQEALLGKDNLDTAITYSNIGDSYYKKQNYRLAKEYAEKAIASLENIQIERTSPIFQKMTTLLQKIMNQDSAVDKSV